MSKLQLKDGGFSGVGVPGGRFHKKSRASTFPDARDREGRSFTLRVDSFRRSPDRNTQNQTNGKTMPLTPGKTVVPKGNVIIKQNQAGPQTVLTVTLNSAYRFQPLQ